MQIKIALVGKYGSRGKRSQGIMEAGKKSQGKNSKIHRQQYPILPQFKRKSRILLKSTKLTNSTTTQ